MGFLKKFLLLVVAVAALIAPTTSLAQYDFCGSLTSEFQGFLECDTDFSSFTQYTGGLETVDPYQYNIDAPATAPEFILNIVNFALFFLGFIAVIFIIYAGFLYVTAAGNEDQAKKGVEIIKQAAIGIIIIFAAIPIVNTVLQAPGGSDGVLSSGPGGVTSQNFNTQQVAGYRGASDQVKHIAIGLLQAYTQYVDQVGIIQDTKNFNVDNLTSRAELIQYLESVKADLNRVARMRPVIRTNISYTTFAVRVVIDGAIDPSIDLLNDVIENERNKEIYAQAMRNGIGGFFDDLRKLGDDVYEGVADGVKAFSNFFSHSDEGFNKRLEDTYCQFPPEERTVQATFDCVGALESNDERYGTDIVTSLNGLIDDVVVEQGINRDYDAAIDDLIDRLDNVRISLRDFGRNSSSNQQFNNQQLLDAFDRAINALSAVKADAVYYDVNLSLNSVNTGSVFNDGNIRSQLERGEIIRGAIEELNNLFDLLDEIVFVRAVARASTVEGSAPLVVQFDCLGSEDPANASITDSSCIWDLDGDGNFGEQGLGESFSACNENGGTTTSCTYKQPGSYRVGLQVTSANNSVVDGQPVAPGLAYLTVVVQEPVARINLKASINDNQFTLREYDDRGFIARDRDNLRATLSEVQANGNIIKFNATGTGAGQNQEGESSNIVSYIWKIDNQEEVISQTPEQDLEFFDNGIYNVTLTVVDEAGNRDRKIFDVIISSLAANLEVTPLRGDLTTEFTFDASGSRSDTGRIPDDGFNWSISGLEGVDIPEAPVVSTTFDEPGTYTVTEQVTDGANNVESASETILVESQKPQVFFTAQAPKPNQPSLILFDARQSFDPDPDDELTFTWTLVNAREGADYEIVSGALTGDREEAGMVALLFKQQRNYVMELTVNDQYQDERLRQEASITTDVNIQKLADVDISEDFQQAALLVNQEAEVALEFVSEFGETIQVDFGDGDTANGLISDGTYRVNHTYTTAGLKQVSATVTDDLGDTSTVTVNVVIGKDQTVIPIVRVRNGDLEYQLTGDLPLFSRDQNLTFDASRSVNIDGTNSGLSYTWNFGDGSVSEGAVVRHKFVELPPDPPGYYEVTLVIASEDQPNVQEEINFPVRIGSLPPIVQDIQITALDPEDTSLVNEEDTPVTPFPVRVQALGASDPDGRITEYRFYYFPINNTSLKLGTKIVDEPEAVIEVDTLGVEGDENEYGFCVDIRDDEGNVVNCRDSFALERIPTIIAVNGVNERPTVELNVDRSNLNVGETVTFSAVATDPDGKIVSYEYDVDGDGSFANDAPVERANLEYVYNRTSSDAGFRVRVKVTDDKGATAISDPIAIYVDSILDDPVAAFTAEESRPGVIQFRNNSRADRARGGEIAVYNWDFDTQVDSDGDGDADNDVDSQEASPEKVYDRPGNFMVKLVIADNEGNTDEVTNTVTVSQTVNDGNTPPANPQPANPNLLRAVLRTEPAINPSDNTIYLSGESAMVTFAFDRSEGDIVKYEIDKNIYFDTNSGAPGTPGDGIRNNDVDHTTTGAQTWTTDFSAAWQPIEVKLTVYDAAGNINSTTAKVVFGGQNLQASVGLLNGSIVLTLLAILGGFGVLLSVTYLLRPVRNKSKKLF